MTTLLSTSFDVSIYHDREVVIFKPLSMRARAWVNTNLEGAKRYGDAVGVSLEDAQRVAESMNGSGLVFTTLN